MPCRAHLLARHELLPRSPRPLPRAASIACVSGIGLHRSTVLGERNPISARATAAAASGVSTRCSRSTGASRAKKNGSRSTPYPTSATPSSSSLSAVAAGSMMDFGPEHTSSPGVRASSNRSALTSGSSPGMHAADPAGGAHDDPGLRGRPDRGAHRGGAELSARDRERVVAARDLRCDARLGEPRELRIAQPHRHRAVHDPDPRRDGVARADGRAHPFDAFTVPGCRQSLPDHARLQGDDAAAVRRCCEHVLGHDEHVTHRRLSPGQVSALDATSAPA